MSRSHYDILGVPSDASTDDIKRAYRILARQYHPDVSDHPGAEQIFKQINEAHAVLTDENKRQQYNDKFMKPHPAYIHVTKFVLPKLDEKLTIWTIPEPYDAEFPQRAWFLTNHSILTSEVRHPSEATVKRYRHTSPGWRLVIVELFEYTQVSINDSVNKLKPSSVGLFRERARFTPDDPMVDLLKNLPRPASTWISEWGHWERSI